MQTLLLVETDPALLSILEDGCRSAGLAPVRAESTREALEVAARLSDFAAVLVGRLTGPEAGLHLLRRLASALPDAGRIWLADEASDDQIIDAFQGGAIQRVLRDARDRDALVGALQAVTPDAEPEAAAPDGAAPDGAAALAHALLEARDLGEVAQAVVDAARERLPQRAVWVQLWDEGAPASAVEAGAGGEMGAELIALPFRRGACSCGELVVDGLDAAGRPLDGQAREDLEALVPLASAACARILERLENGRALDAVLATLAEVASARRPGTEPSAARAAAIVERMAQELPTVSAEEARALGRSAELSHLGDATLPDALVMGPGAFPAAAQELRRAHSAAMGDRLAALAAQHAPLAHLADAAAVLCATARGGEVDEAPLAARLVACAERYLRLTQSTGHGAALEALRAAAGGELDPAAVEALCACADEVQRLRRDAA